MKFPTALIAGCLFATTVPAAEPTIISDFEGADYGAWKTTGTAFGSGPAKGALPGQMNVEGFAGRGLANSFHGGDPATGTLASPEFGIERKFITFLIGGGGLGGTDLFELDRRRQNCAHRDGTQHGPRRE